jgi:hypothetical protein
MGHWSLVAIYLAIGIALGGVVYARANRRDARTAASAATTVVLWPLWVPFAWTPPATSPRDGPLAARIGVALDEARRTAAGTGAARALRDDTARLMRRVQAAERRLVELDARVASMKADRVERPPSSAEASLREQIRTTSLAQLEALRDREHKALLELAELCELLLAQLVVARFGGADRVEELRDELWARVQALSELG